MRKLLAVFGLLALTSMGGCCSGPDDVRIFFTAPDDASDVAPWSESLRLPPSFDIVVAYSDDSELADVAIELYRDADDQRVDITETTTRGVEHDGECPHTHTVYAIRSLDNGYHRAVHRRASGTGAEVDLSAAPAWSSFDGDEALIFELCVDDNSGMSRPCG